MFEQLTLLVVAIAGLPVSGKVIAVAGVVLALVVAIGGFLVYRSGGKKGTKAATGTGNNDWQRQPQQQGGAANGWNPQGPGNDAQQPWAQQQVQGQQAGWGAQQNAPPQQGWGAQQNAPMQQPGANSWGGQNGIPQGANTPWGDGQVNAPQQPAWGGGMQNGGNQWAASGNQTAQPIPTNSWDAQGNPGTQPASANQWDAPSGGQGGRAAWDAPQPAPVAQEPWGQPAQQQWGGQANMAPQAPQAPIGGPGGGIGSGPSWNQQGFGQNGQNAQDGLADGWGAPKQQQQTPQNANNAVGGFAGIGSVPQAPAWQQQQAGFGQGAPGMQQNQGTPFDGMNNGFGANDGDRTIMRSAGGLGLVRVEEGKEPGREYKIVKESLSIGRSRESDIFLEDLAVSRLHASVVNLGNGQYALKDEGSANGTKVNGQLVNKFQTFPLQEGDRIQLGQTVLVFARG